MTHIANALQELKAAHDLGEDPPYDTTDAALWRVRFTLRAFYDAPAEPDPDPEELDDTPLGDLLIDLVHYANHHDLNIYGLLESAEARADVEVAEWAARS